MFSPTFTLTCVIAVAVASLSVATTCRRSVTAAWFSPTTAVSVSVLCAIARFSDALTFSSLAIAAVLPHSFNAPFRSPSPSSSRKEARRACRLVAWAVTTPSISVMSAVLVATC
ncbi:hypothetical protein D3C86_1641710 [compost metagenome]